MFVVVLDDIEPSIADPWGGRAQLAERLPFFFF
jgi:hypothetical protein